jgi:hypothetical protein
MRESLRLKVEKFKEERGNSRGGAEVNEEERGGHLKVAATLHRKIG